MSDAHEERTDDTAARSQRIGKIIAKCREWLAEGREVPAESLVAKFPDLMPELGQELKKLRMIEAARQEAANGAADQPSPPAKPPIAQPPNPAASAPPTAPSLNETHSRVDGLHDTVTLPPDPPRPDETTPLPSAPPPQSRPRIRYFGDYELLEELGRGGMGVVYKAKQLSLNRTVAVKMILSGNLASDEDVKRFLAEAEAAANLEHANIVPIHEVGEHEGKQYFSMAYVEGQSLSAMVRDQPLPSRQAAEYLKLLADAMAYAHDRGVLHRDLKPANVLVDRKDRPRITDFGLAKRVDADSELTATGQVLGTPSYMPPEQARGDHERVGPHSDQYALGALLYALLTGRPPFQAENAMATLFQVLEQEPVTPRTLNLSIDRDLETICLKCLEKDPKNRYGDCAALSTELDHYLAGRPIQARPISRPAKAWRWCKRNPVTAGLIAAVVTALIVGSGVAMVLAAIANHNALLASNNAGLARKGEASALEQKARADETADKLRSALVNLEEQKRRVDAERDEAERLRRVAQARLAESQRAAFNLQIGAARDAMDRRPGQALKMLDDERLCPPQLRDFTWGLLHRFADREQLRFTGHMNPVTQAEYLPGGDRIVTLGQDELIRFWDARTGECVGVLPGARCMAVVPGKAALATGDKNGKVRFWNVETYEEMSSIAPNKSPVSRIVLAPTGELIASAGRDGDLVLWDCQDNRPIVSVKRHVNDRIWDSTPQENSPMAFSPDGSMFVFPVRSGVASLLHIKDKRQDELKLHGDPITALAFSPSGEYLASAAFSDGKAAFQKDCLVLWNVPQKRRTRNVDIFRTHNARITDIAFTPDGASLATSGLDGSIRLWQTDDLTETLRLEGHHDAVRSVAFAPDGKTIVSAADDWTAIVWSPSPRLETASRKVAGSAYQVAFAPDGKQLAVATGDNDIRLLDAETLEQTGSLSGHKDQVLSLGYAQEAPILASSSFDGHVLVHNLRKQENQLVYQAEPGRMVGSVAISRDGQTLAWIDSVKQMTGTIKRPIVGIRNPSGEVSELEVKWPAESPFRLAFPPTGERLMAVGGSGVQVWDLRTCKQIAFHKTQSSISLAFSPADGRLATGEFRGAVSLWSANLKGPRLELPGHAGGVDTLAFSPEGNLLATGGRDGTIRLWDTENGQERVRMEAHQMGVVSIAFSPNGMRLVSCDYRGTVKLWNGISEPRKTRPAAWSQEMLTQLPARMLYFCGSEHEKRHPRLRGSADARFTAISYYPLVQEGKTPSGSASRTAYAQMKRLVESNADVLNWQFCYYPLDEMGYEAACRSERVRVLCGTEAFWQFLDALFEAGSWDSTELAALEARCGVTPDMQEDRPLKNHRDYAILHKQRAQIYAKILKVPATIIVDNVMSRSTIIKHPPGTHFTSEYFEDVIRRMKAIPSPIAEESDPAMKTVPDEPRREPPSFLPGSGQSYPPFESAEVQAAVKQFETKLQELREQYVAAQSQAAEIFEKASNDDNQTLLDALEIAHQKAMQADDLDEALKLQQVREELTKTKPTPPASEHEERRRQELQAFLPGTRWTSGDKNEFFFGRGSYMMSSDPPASRPERRWGATSANSIEATYPDGRGTMTFSEARTHLLFVHDQGFTSCKRVGGRLVAGRAAPPMVLQSKEVIAVIIEHAAKQQRLSEQCVAAQRRLAETYEKDAEEAKQALLEALEAARKKAIQADDPDEALKLQNAHKECAATKLTASDARREQMRGELKAFLPGTRWSCDDGAIVFDRGFTWPTQRPDEKDRWRVISENTVEVVAGTKHTRIFNDARTHFMDVTATKHSSHKLLGRSER